MKYPAHIYAKALAEVITTPGVDAEVIVKNFSALLRKNGDEVHAQKIVEEAARFARGKAGIRKVIIESARTLTSKQKKETASFIKEGDVVQEKIVPELVAGIRVFINDEKIFDGSLKGKLDSVFTI
ncbi:MAG: F0F1 ATP synthase subunit delta [Patescibacteria group bacterium]|nr:F0F1 ATP synthase subunit delta [Patescibacteria group bacterium]MDE2015769.1 F0F1 ATP synthase subunit delta [Patescibacteria group bacterium]MDE2226826.1 F0F1 ATP synthase subunit delta [Patescibacteria group bacterium]